MRYATLFELDLQPMINSTYKYIIKFICVRTIIKLKKNMWLDKMS